ncbi:YihY/virulence factor BrkB family protein [Rhizobium alvei]|uniref:YihY/virulence factor BrkB family protein n=1 Tax=Rhizobium alvei TaxID=1132659 RepID=A0ABT8YRJ2_9HYPH|nr:YihY/virulence factor BrkB family protein [Rhizobium alvei]MDO6966303.1 YihY/virulence factor BrkB family protein [Rhizobium alvei]
MPAIIRVIWKVVFDAIWHFTEDDGWAMASHVALSALLAIFPFLIFGTTLANFLGADQFADTAVHLIFDRLPKEIAAPISKEVVAVLTTPRGGLLTVSVLAAAYFASNGVEALRISLNRAYRVYEPRRWYITRLISLGYVIGAVMSLVALSTFLVFVPLAIKDVGQWMPWLTPIVSVLDNWSSWGAIATIVIALFITHLYLPAGRRRFFDVFPGIFLTLVAWVAGAKIFTYYLAEFANYTATYAGLASIMIALVFLYMIGVIFMLGAEINAALLKYRVRYLFTRRSTRGQADPAADI